MRRTTFVVSAGLVLGLAALAGFAPLAACSDGAAPPKAAAPDAASAFTYRGAACAYDVAPPERYAFTELVNDDPASPGAAPQLVRVGLGGGTTMGAPGYADPSRTAVFTWQTKDKVRAAKLRFGDKPDALTEVRAGFSWTTPPPDTGFGTNEPETSMHEVHVCGLTPARTYYYQVGGGATEVWSPVQSFTTVPTDGKITVGVLGDARDKVDVWQLAQKRMRDRAVNLQLTTGDLVAFGSQQSLYETWLGAIWKDPADPNRFITLGQQMMVMIAGNHENEAARFYGAFAMPGEGTYAETYNSFNVGNTHFVMIDDQPIASFEGSEHSQVILSWLDQDLARADANRAAVPFLFVINHRGLFTTSQHAADGDVRVARRLLAPIFDKHHVDVVLNGHDHIFERTKAITAGATPAGDPIVVAAGQPGTVYVVNAGAGADPYRVDPSVAAFQEKSEVFGPGTSYSGFYGVLTLEGRKLKFDSYGLTAAGNDPVVDTFELTK
jgi:predicted phosphodiesterase